MFIRQFLKDFWEKKLVAILSVTIHNGLYPWVALTLSLKAVYFQMQFCILCIASSLVYI